MCKNILIKGFILSLMLAISPNGSAAQFNVSGKITRTLTDGVNYGKCMVLLDVNIGNGCPASGWVSLDCQNKYYPKGDGDRKFNSAIAAAMSGKRIFVVVDNGKKHSGYCVAQRLDVVM